MSGSRDLPENIEYLVYGTGVSESVLSAALSRIGKTVLHLDKKEYYGGLWSTFNFSDFNRWLEDMKIPRAESDNRLGGNIFVKDILWEWGPRITISDLPPEEENEIEEVTDRSEDIWTPNRLRSLDRQFNIDVMPKFLFARGATVDNLLQSDAGRYLEFLPIKRLIAIRPDGVKMRVPANRYEMFKSRLLQPRQKWQISSFLQWCVSAEDNDENILGYENRTLRDMLVEWKNMDQACVEIVINTMAMSRLDIGTREGLARLKRMLQSLNRYGPYPFLWPLYGSGELPQSYCRFSAVFGGIYCLGRSIREAEVEEDGACHRVTLCNGQTITFEKALIMHSAFVSEAWLDKSSEAQGWIARAIFLTDAQFVCADAEEDEDSKEITILSFPFAHCREPALIIELPSEAKACPKGLYLVHVIATVTDPDCTLTARELFEPLMSTLFGQPGQGETTAPRALWSAFFRLPHYATTTSASAPSNLHVMGGPDAQLDFDSAVEAARSLFEQLCPDEPFMPRAPSADEILIEDDEHSVPGPPAVAPEENGLLEGLSGDT